MFVRTARVPYYNSSVALTLLPLPPPTVSSILASAGCLPNTSTSYTDCVPLSSFVSVRGLYLSGSSMALVSASGVATPCVDSAINTATSSFCDLPAIPSDQDGDWYDLRITTMAGSITIPKLLSFSTQVQLSKVLPCIRSGLGSMYALCGPGSTMTIVGNRFVQSPDASLVLSPRTWSTDFTPVNATCGNLTVQNQNTFTCVAPTLDGPAAAMYGSAVFARLFEPATNSSTRTMLAYFLNYPDAPVVGTVTGCSAALDPALSPLGVGGCRSGDVLTMRGSNLNGTTLRLRAVGSTAVTCNVVGNWTSEEVMCKLPFFLVDQTGIAEGTVYTITVATIQPNTPLSTKTGNAFDVAFTFAPRGTSNGRSSPPLALVLALSIALPCLALLALTVTLLLCRGKPAFCPLSASCCTRGGPRMDKAALHWGVSSDSSAELQCHQEQGEVELR